MSALRETLNIYFSRFIVVVIIISLSTLYTDQSLCADQKEMVLIPAGEFIMGSGPEDGKAGVDYGVDEEPRHKVYLNAFYIDKYEVTIGKYKKFLQATDGKWVGDPNFPGQYLPERLFNPPDWDIYPVNYMTWSDADSFCRWDGKRLITEAEWEKAARGTDGRKWPWGNESDPEKFHVLENSQGWTAPVGSHPEDISPYGVYDMGGNLSEWTSSYYLPYPGNKINDGRYTKNVYVLRGGSFHLSGEIYGRNAARSLAYPAYSHRMFGIRCAKDAP